jgi:hypothetical protein
MSEVLAPTFAQQVSEEHRELRRKVFELREFLKMPRPRPGEPGAHTWAAALLQQLASFHDELCRHFRFEDEGGMVEDMVREHPRVANAAEALAAEHPELLGEVRWLMNDTLTYSEGHRPEDRALRRRTTDLLDCLRKHEQAEIEMIHRLECDDIGVGD